MKTTLVVYLIIYKLTFFESLIVFLEPTIINCRNIWFAKVTITLIMMAQMLFLIFFSKNTRTLSPLSCFLILEIFCHSHAGDFLTQHIRISDGALLVGISESFLNFKKQDFSTNQQSFMLSFEVVIFLFCSTCMV